MTLRLIATGGTFDKVYQPLTGALGFDHTQLSRMIERARVSDPVMVEQAMLIDSLDMTDEHRARIVELCRQAPENRIIVTHGTDTMAETARALGALGLRKTIVLTGAMIPYRVADSDALFNLGYAIACARHAPPGVWIAMGATTFAWDDVRKNRELGAFETESRSAPDRAGA